LNDSWTTKYGQDHKHQQAYKIKTTNDYSNMWLLLLQVCRGLIQL